MNRKLIILPFLLIIPAIFLIVNFPKPGRDKALAPAGLDEIRKRGKLVAVTDFNSTDYFIYRGEPMGFNYELLRSFSDFSGIDLEIIGENNLSHATAMLRSGEVDLIAFGLASDATLSRELIFTDPLDETRQVLVQRKSNGLKNPSSGAGGRMVRSLQELTGKPVYVQENSSYQRRLEKLEKELGISIDIVAVPDDPEKLIKLVAEGEIDYTVCDENIAAVNATYYPVIDLATQVSEKTGLSWAVRKENSAELTDELNKWISSFRRTQSYAVLKAKYFSNSRSGEMVRSDYFSLNSGRVSDYDDIIRKFSSSIDWDWRLLASLICQESEFRPNVVSARGAYGLMQIMPVTGKNFGIDITSSPENNIRAGIQYIGWLNSIFEPKISDPKERLNFILASYNAGPGHVLDAMRLAGKNGMDPYKWDGSVALWLQKKSKPEYYRDSVVRNGYFRGKESVRFVSEVLERYEHYRNIIPQEVNHSF